MTNSQPPFPLLSISRAEEVATYGNAIVGKTFTIIRTSDLKPGDKVIRLNVINVGYEVPLRVKRVTQITREFYDVEFEGRGHKELPRFAHTCLFGLEV